MRGADLLGQLRERGAHVELIAGRLRVRPRSAVQDLEASLREHLEAVVEALEVESRRPADREESESSEERPARSYTPQEVRAIQVAHADLTDAERDCLEAEAAAGDPLADAMLRTVATDSDAEPVAWRLYSRRLDLELWLVRDLEALAQLERDRVLGDLPAVLGDELADLAGLDDATLRALLAMKQSFGPTTRVVDLPPEDEGVRS